MGATLSRITDLLFPWERHAAALEVPRGNPDPATIVFYDADGEFYGIASLDDEGRIRYSNDRVRDTMDACVITKGSEWAWAWFSRWSNGYSASKLSTDHVADTMIGPQTPTLPA